MTKTKKIVLAVVAAILVAGLITGIYFAVVMGVPATKRKSFLSGKQFGDVVFQTGTSTGTERIHFLNTGGSDAILLESNGHFALVDGGEDTDNVRGFRGLALEGYEKAVVNYLIAVAGDSEGKVKLDFVLGTHAHSDHIGGLDTVILHPNITVEKAYLKRYDEQRIDDMEVEEWDNKEVYEQMVNACKTRGVELVQDLVDVTFPLGNFKISILNGEEDTSGIKKGENENALGVLVESGKWKTFLAADINNFDGDEARLAPILGKVNLLKLGHHGLDGSSSRGFVKTLNPDVAVITGWDATVGVKQTVTFVAKAPIVTTIKDKGLIAEFSNTGIAMYAGFMERQAEPGSV